MFCTLFLSLATPRVVSPPSKQLVVVVVVVLVVVVVVLVLAVHTHVLVVSGAVSCGVVLWGGGQRAEGRGQRVDRLSSPPARLVLGCTGSSCSCSGCCSRLSPTHTAPLLHCLQQLQWAAVGVPCSPSLLAGVCAHTVGCFIRSFIQTSCYYYSSHIALFVLRPRIL